LSSLSEEAVVSSGPYRVSESGTDRGSQLRRTALASTVTRDVPEVRRPPVASACADGAAPEYSLRVTRRIVRTAATMLSFFSAILPPALLCQGREVCLSKLLLMFQRV
jgi:hypothetical protein